MASKALASIALLLSLNLLFFTLVTCSYVSYAPSSPVTPSDEYQNYPMPQSPAKPSYCPKNALNLGVCANVLKKLLKLEVGEPPKMPCCSLIHDLVDLDAAVCLCTSLKAYVLGIKLDVHLSLELLLNYCGKEVPHGFLCA